MKVSYKRMRSNGAEKTGYALLNNSAMPPDDLLALGIVVLEMIIEKIKNPKYTNN